MIVLDTSFLVSLLMKEDKRHALAKELVVPIENGDYGEAVITDYIFDEAMTWFLSDTNDISKVKSAGDRFRESYKILNTNSMIFERAWERFSSQKGTRLSFTDCAIIDMMSDNGITYLATFDKDFKHVDSIKTVGV